MPPAIFVTALVVFSVRSPLTVTPLNRLLLLAAMISVLLSAKASVPPLSVPPLSVHEPVELFSVSVLPALLIVPVTFTVPAVLLQVPMPPVALNVPPRFTVAAFTLIVPALLQLVELIVRMPPPVASRMPVALLARLAAG